MKLTIAHLKKGESAIIKGFSTDIIPIKLLELGCLPGNKVELLQIAPFKDPLYLNINGSFLTIRRSTALEIEIDMVNQKES